MMGDLVILRPCGCGAPGLPRFVLAGGLPIGEADICDRCVDDINSGSDPAVAVDYRPFTEGGLFYP